MDIIVFLVMRRMRMPLLVLLGVYTITVFGLTVIPGINGPPLDFLHAFYVTSYTATTIGFGEIPDPFTIAQRLWLIFCIYLTVIGWLYAMGTLLSLIQDPALRMALRERQFAKRVKRLREPFFLICGYGDTGRALVSALEERYLRTVVIEIDQERVNMLTLENFPVYVPALCADAARPKHLTEAGLKKSFCKGIVALTDDNFANLHVAITAKLLRKNLPVICRVDSAEAEANMRSFGTDEVINPFEIFSSQLHTALHTPSLHILREWLIGHPISEFRIPPKRGLWILCSYGRFGKAVFRKLSREPGVRLVTIESSPDIAGYARGEVVTGLGTEVKTLEEAHIKQAVGIIAGTDDDVNNLSIVMTARELNKNLFVVLRQNKSYNQPIVEAGNADIAMQASQITAAHIRVLLTTPLFIDFLRQSKRRGEDWCRIALHRVRQVLKDCCQAEKNRPDHYKMPPPSKVPRLWEQDVNRNTMPALYERHLPRRAVSMSYLLRHPQARERRLDCLPLLLVRHYGKPEQETLLLPDETECIREGDRLLWCGTHDAMNRMQWNMKDYFVFHYVSTGNNMARSSIWRWLEERRRQKLREERRRQRQQIEQP